MNDKKQTKTVTISALGDHGDGLAELENGQRIYVQNTLAGEQVIVQLQHNKDKSVSGVVDEILTPSVERVEPPCMHYHKCGGCQMQHMNESAYRKWKENNLLAQMRMRLGENVKPEILPPIYIGEGTRRRVSFSAIKQGKTMTLGYNQRRSHYITDIQSCLLLTPQLNALIGVFKKYLPEMLVERRAVDVMLQQSDTSIDCMITGPVEMTGKKGRDLSFAVRDCAGQIVRETDVARISWRFSEREAPEILVQQENIFKDMGKFKPALSAGAFLQPSVDGENALVQAVLDAIPDTAKRCVDLFAGYGTFTGKMVEADLAVDAFEGEDNAIQAMRKAGHGQSYTRDLFQQPLKEKELKPYDVVVLDPPRAGAQKQCQNIAKSNVSRVIYVSCSPNNFFKDALHIIGQGRYQLTSLQMIDQFRWSTHAELIGVFEKI